MENPAHSFRETNLVLQLIQESQIKNKIVNALSKYTYFYISKNITLREGYTVKSFVQSIS